ncbi:MAG: hypothetical protein PVH63_04505 [Balneolaceae bacterium]|jgi:hypothetical protein
MPSKTVAQKMYIKRGMTIGFFNAPDNLKGLLGNLPEGITIRTPKGQANLDWVLGFIEDQKMLEDKLGLLKRSIIPEGALWIAYHKGSSSVDTDINRDDIHTYASTLSLKGVAMVSINENWSGFRFKKV